MNIFQFIASAGDVLKRGKSIPWASVLNNTEAGSAALYGLFSGLIALLNASGIEVTVGGTDVHNMANGTTALISVGYAVYRAATNPEAGLKNGDK
jgi:hypothetical protein